MLSTPCAVFPQRGGPSAMAKFDSVAANFRRQGTSKRFIGSDRRVYQVSWFPGMNGTAASGCVEVVVRGTKGAADETDWVKNQQVALTKIGVDLSKTVNTYDAIKRLLTRGPDKK